MSVPHPWPEGTRFARRKLDVTLRPEEGRFSLGALYFRRRNQIAYPGADTLRLYADGERLTMTCEEDGQRRELVADMQGGRTPGVLAYPYAREVISRTSACAWWDEDGRLQVDVLWVETEVENRIAFSFDGDLVHIDKWFAFGTSADYQHQRCVYRRA